MIGEIRKNVKRKIVSVASSIADDNVSVKKPFHKYILEIVTGILASKSCNLTEIARSLKEDIAIKDTLKRIRRNVHNHPELLELSNYYNMDKWKEKVREETIIALDGGDICHHFGDNFENHCRLRDGSTGSTGNGYYLNQISCYNPSEGITFPMYLDIYSSEEQNFKSMNTESMKAVDNVVSIIGDKGLWVLDRGYDGGIMLNYFLNRDLDFVTRLTKKRYLVLGDKSISIPELVKKINRRYKIGKSFRFGYKKCHIKLDGKLHPVTVMVNKGEENKEPHILLTNGHIKKSREIRRRVMGYYHRWGVEECYRFEKQGFGIEKSLTPNFNAIKSLLGASMLVWSVLLMVQEDEELKEQAIANSKREKTKKKDRPKFIYYSLLDGISRAFIMAKEIFRFRKPKPPKLAPTIDELLNKRSLGMML